MVQDAAVCLGALCGSVSDGAGTPVVAIAIVLVALERTIGIGVFDPTKGGDPLFSSICSGFTRIQRFIS